MGQTRSTVLHRIPYSMVWNTSIFEKKNKWFYIFNVQISNFLLNSFLHFSLNDSKLNWFWRDKFINNFNNLNKYITEFSTLNIRFFLILSNPNKRKLLSNTNNWSNSPIQGKLNFFDLNNNLYCLHAYYLQNFFKIKKRKIKTKKFSTLKFNFKNLYKYSKPVVKILKNKIKFKIKTYKNSVKSNYFLNINNVFIFKYLKFNMLLKNINLKNKNTKMFNISFNFFKKDVVQYLNFDNYLKYTANLFYFFEDLNSNFFLEILYIK